MVVRSQCDGHRVTGIYVGASNVRRYFRKGIATIELQLDHLRIACGLTPHFWQDAPEIQDPRLCAWLESKHRDMRGARLPVAMDLIPSGDNCFILDAVQSGLKTLGNQKIRHQNFLEVAEPSAELSFVGSGAEFDSPPPF